MQRDRDLRRYDTIIIDEAHERSLNIDFLLGYLRRLLPQRPDLKVIITSATIDPQRFADHFAQPGKPVPVIDTIPAQPDRSSPPTLTLIALVVFVLPESHPTHRRTAFVPKVLVAGLVRAGRSAAFHRLSWAASLSFAGYFVYVGAAPIMRVPSAMSSTDVVRAARRPLRSA